MNWLAHLFLSEPNPAFRIGNLLPDLVPTSDLAGLPGEFLRGVEQHRRIDAFTDSHPIFRQSVRRVGPEFRRFGGILVDIFYDHFLTADWTKRCATPLPVFTEEIYNSFENHRSEIPTAAHFPLERMKAENWLCAYGDFKGVSTTLGRIALRLRRPVPLANAISVLENDYAGFRGDFAAFFPELVSHVRAQK